MGKELGAPLYIIQGSAFIAIGILFAINIFIGKTQLCFL